MFSDSINYLFSKFIGKRKYILVQSTEVYDPLTGNTVVTEKNSNIKVMALSINDTDLPDNCLSTDILLAVMTDEIDISDKIKDDLDQFYSIKHIKRTNVSPLVYEVIIRVN